MATKKIGDLESVERKIVRAVLKAKRRHLRLKRGTFGIHRGSKGVYVLDALERRCLCPISCVLLGHPVVPEHGGLEVNAAHLLGVPKPFVSGFVHGFDGLFMVLEHTGWWGRGCAMGRKLAKRFRPQPEPRCPT